MSVPRIAKALDHIDDALISEATDSRNVKKASRWLRWGAIAACLAVVVIAGVRMLPGSDRVQTSIGGVARAYKDVSVLEHEEAIEWPWEYRTVSERYSTVTYDKAGYTIKAANWPIDSSFLDGSLGICDAIGYDMTTGQGYHESSGVRQITGISPDLMIAVELDGQFYVFQRDGYDPSAALGDVLDGYSLAQTLELDRFEVYDNGGEKGCYSLSEDGPIWEILAGCRDAQFVEDDGWGYADRDHISFTATSEPLGVYKRVFYVFADGDISTNIFDWGYTFHIGEDAAKEIISYARENAAEAEREPYTYSLAGTLTEIGDGYILVDDTILCADPKDGMVFKVPTSDLRISRCLDHQGIGPGDLVMIHFTGDVDADGGNAVFGAVSMSRASIHEGEVMIPE